MFGIGFQEMLVILVVVLIFFGPKRLPDLAKSIGKGIAEFKKASEEVRQGIQEAMKEETPPAVPPAQETPPAVPPAEGAAAAPAAAEGPGEPAHETPAETTRPAPPGDGR